MERPEIYRALVTDDTLFERRGMSVGWRDVAGFEASSALR
jgi:hypothetical protein